MDDALAAQLELWRFFRVAWGVVCLKKTIKKRSTSASTSGRYAGLVSGISDLLETARHTSARTINALMTATYWEIGRRIVEFEQDGEKRAEYGMAVLERLSNDLTVRYGRGFGRPNLIRFRQFYGAFPETSIRSTLSNESLDIPAANRSTAFLLELGNDFAFVGRQRRLRIDDEWYRVDLL
jgi:hypothetical protein